MSDVKSIEQAVQSLAPADLAEFRRWFTEFDSVAWDRQIETDIASGRLDKLLAEAEQDFKIPPSRSL
jgi:predicted esterase